jgi:phosphoribosylaminoimidazolecarboxamide formyltransferase / IMP cyclohydrolase
MPESSALNPVRRALLSVSDKTGLEELASELVRRGVELVSTGGTAALLRNAGYPVVEVAELTGFPEILDGRVKTLHPGIHGGLLARRGRDEAVLAEHGIRPFDLLVVNLYPFEQVTRETGCTWERAVEHIDVGGPAMLRAASKNHEYVSVVVDPEDYPQLIAALEAGAGSIDRATRRAWAIKAFRHTARYDTEIAAWLSKALEAATAASDFRPPHIPGFGNPQRLRYGENPHQIAAVVPTDPPRPGSAASAVQLAGRPLSYNNLLDVDAALDCLGPFAEPACVIVKHSNPCGVAIGGDPLGAYAGAYATDPVSAFGGVIAFNRPLTGELLRAVLEKQFVEVVVAPEVTETALTEAARKPELRILAVGTLPSADATDLNWRSISGGLLVQSSDIGDEAIEPGVVRVVSARTPSAEEWADLRFAWRVARSVRSNAIVYAARGCTLGIGAGQSSRVDSARIATFKAADRGLTLTGSVMASDAFLPFRDGLDAAAAAGIRAVIQPGGSIRDAEVIAAADEHDIAMVFTGRRHFRH